MAVRMRLPLQPVVSTNSLALRKPVCLIHTEAVAAKEPAYPPLVASLTAKSKSARRRQIEESVAKACALPIPEKISHITRIQRMKYVVYPQTFARNADPWYQHFTKTAYIPGLPDKFTLGPVGSAEDTPTAASSLGIADDAFNDLRTLVEHSLLQEQWHMKKRRAFLYKEQEQNVGPFLRNVVPGLTYRLTKYNPLLNHCSIDLQPFVHFYWARGQITIPKGHRKGRVDPTRFQIDDQPHSQIRVTEQLPAFTPMEASYALEVPEVKYSPGLLPLFKRQYNNHIFTGSKVQDPACYGHTQFHMVPDFYRRDRMAKRRQADQVEVFLRCNGLASLFAWTAAQAMYQGFWSHQDVTRPFVSQAVVTDGQFFSFFCYQLNTVALSVETDVDNPRKNLFWGTESMRLYEDVRDGEVVGLNEDVIRLLIQFLLNKP